MRISEWSSDVCSSDLSVTSIPGLGGVPYLTSTTAFELESVPASLLMIGGGYIGCELAQMFARAGVAVTLLFRSRLLPEAEPEISEALAGYPAQDGIDYLKVRDYRKGGMNDGGVALSVQDDDGYATFDVETMPLRLGPHTNNRGTGL